MSGVGGTTLSADRSGNYQGETAWSGSGGGDSTVFGVPSYQAGDNGMRTVPDVSSNPDPNTGFAMSADNNDDADRYLVIRQVFGPSR